MEIFKEITSKTTIITPNRRLTASLLSNYETYQLTHQHQCWFTLDILPYQTWIQRIWNEISITLMDMPFTVLSNHQEHIIWEKILKNSPKNDSLLQLSATAELVKTAWATLKQWQVNLDHPLLNTTEDSQAFQEWALAFHEYCEKNNLIDQNTLVSKIIEHMGDLRVLPDKLVIAGFTELSPIQHTLFKIYEQAGVQIILTDNLYSTLNSTSSYISLSDFETEIITMARWAKAILMQHKLNNPMNIACIIPTLENTRDRIVQLFSEVLSNNDFNISAGKSLTSYPIIFTAFQILKLSYQHISIKHLSTLLLTPFIGNAENEYIKRATFDNHLRNENIIALALKNLSSLNIEKFCPAFAKRIFRFIEICTSEPEQLLPSEWVDKMMDKLGVLGWPGERSINSHEYQVVQRFLDLLNEYKTFDSITFHITHMEAVQHIERLAAKTIFQPQSENAPIQILGLLEAANLPFDYAWVVGLDDSTWPPSAKPNPFIPHKLQKLLNMPHATGDKELQYSNKLTQQLKQSAKTIIFSHALKLGDCDLRPSALISNNPKLCIEDITQSNYTTLADVIYQSRSTEYICDEKAPPVLTDEKLIGGVNIFKQQAACPFKAFAEIRLHAKKMKSLSLGIRSEDRGTITHKALELVWKCIKDQETLIHLDERELNEIIRTSAKESIEYKIKDISTKSKYFALELERLSKLLYKWLMLEKARPPFKVISNEEERNLTIGPISLCLRVDRIDQLENGDQLVIDYKTGKYNSPKYWFSARPEEPQLPLYCLSNPINIKALAFGEVHPDKIMLNGISQYPLEIDRIKLLQEINDEGLQNWDDQIRAWEKIFDALANEFTKGNASVSPKNIIETCQYCDLKPLCRIHERQVE